MRSTAEIAFRARQEAANVLLLARRPKFAGEAPTGFPLPQGGEVASALRGTEYARQVAELASKIMAHRFPLLGMEIDTGREIRWRRDYAHGIESGTAYFRRIPYLDFARVGDHKVIWELNRHQHLVLLAQAYVLSGEVRFAQEIYRQLESWMEQNPFQRGINWASALEVAFRALSWIWIYHLTAEAMEEKFRRRFLTELYRHGLHLAENLSIYFSPNTHLLGEAVALHALGRLFSPLACGRKWQRTGARIVEEQLAFQVQPDGSHFEQSTYYHVYAFDFFLFFYVIAGRPASFEPVLARMAEYLYWLLGRSRRLTFWGDDDGGRLFHPFGARDEFGRATLATCGILLGNAEWMGTEQDAAEQAVWWIGPEALRYARERPAVPTGARLFANSGAAFLSSQALSVQMDCGPFGWGSGGHSHSDTLSVIAWRGGEQIFIDPGTYAYVSDPEERNWFRSSAAHNTVRIDGLDQGRAGGPFRWNTKPEVVLKEWKPGRDGGVVEAECRYEQFTHRRRLLLEGDRLLILDEIDGLPGEHVCEQIWQLGAGASSVSLAFSAPPARMPSKFSPAYGMKRSGEALVVKAVGQFPLRIAMRLEAEGWGAAHGKITTEEAEEMLRGAGNLREAAETEGDPGGASDKGETQFSR